MKNLLRLLSVLTALSLRAELPPDSFLENCVFVSVDVQAPGPRMHLTPSQVPQEWVRQGITAEDANAAIDYAYDVAFPNSRRVADACRSARLPMIFLHWGCLFSDRIDLDPVIRQTFLAQHGTEYSKWGHHVSDPGSQPAAVLGVREGEYVLPKTAQDAFASSNISFMLTNLGAKHIVFIGGHTGACLGKTAASAKRLGYQILVVQDATFDARQSARMRCIEDTGYHYVVSAAEFEAYVRAALARRASGK